MKIIRTETSKIEQVTEGNVLHVEETLCVFLNEPGDPTDILTMTGDIPRRRGEGWKVLSTYRTRSFDKREWSWSITQKLQR